MCMCLLQPLFRSSLWLYHMKGSYTGNHLCNTINCAISLFAFNSSEEVLSHRNVHKPHPLANQKHSMYVTGAISVLLSKSSIEILCVYTYMYNLLLDE